MPNLLTVEPNGSHARPTIHQVRCGSMPNRSARRWVELLPIPVARTRSSVMQTSRRIIVALILGTTALAAPVLAFDGAPVDSGAAIPVAAAAAQPGTATALRKAIPSGTSDGSGQTMDYATVGSEWKLGRAYADGNGVAQDDLRA